MMYKLLLKHEQRRKTVLSICVYETVTFCSIREVYNLSVITVVGGERRRRPLQRMPPVTITLTIKMINGYTP